MSEAMTGSTVPRRQLGRYLRDERNRAGLTVKDAAKGLEWSETKIWRIETGQISLRSLDVEAICRLYRVDPGTAEVLKGLAKETKAKGWWQAYGDAVPEYFDLFVGLEAAATRMSKYEAELVPGLFQTEDYARTLVRSDHPDEDDAEIERRVELRMARQAILRRPVDPPALRVVLSESVVRRPVSGAAVMAAQLRHLAQVAELPNVELRIIPFKTGFHPGMFSGAFTILRFPLNGGGVESEPPTVYSDMFTGALYLDKPHEVARYARAFEDIWNMGLGDGDTMGIVDRAAEELGNG